MDSIAIRFILGKDENGNWQSAFREVDDTISAGDIAIFWSKIGTMTISLDDDIQAALGTDDKQIFLKPEEPVGFLVKTGFELKNALINRKIEVTGAVHPTDGPAVGGHIVEPQPGCFPP